MREFWEETGLDVKVVRLLWEGVYGHGDRTSPEYCFLVEKNFLDCDHRGVYVGSDPEEAHLAAEERLLQGMGWVALAELANDPQVARVLLALT